MAGALAPKIKNRKEGRKGRNESPEGSIANEILSEAKDSFVKEKENTKEKETRTEGKGRTKGGQQQNERRTERPKDSFGVKLSIKK